ncbi:MAG: terpene cyclase/mutase family protein [Planctomycetes bacterium]|nr:terpene cyclase/mutase family protein [Planctomycetota bacterium]
MLLRPVLTAAIAGGCLLLSATQADAKPKKTEKKEYTIEQVNLRITAGLEWFADHQNEDGSWSMKDFSTSSLRVRAKRTHNARWVTPGEPEGDSANVENQNVAATALALLCFAGMGYDHKEGDYREYVRRGILHLRKVQDSNGCFGEAAKACVVHDSAMATMALAEMYGLSADAILKPTVDKGVEYLLNARNDDAGWRYGIKPGDNDTQMTGWCLLALKSASMAGIEADYAPAWEGGLKFMESMTIEMDGVPRTGYAQPGAGSPRNRATATWEKTPDMDAVYVLCRLFSGDKDWGTKNKDLKKQAALFNANLPKWEEKKVDLAYWYYATLAMYQYGGKDWDTWVESLLEALMENQRGYAEGEEDTFEAVLDEHGSWDSVGVWHPTGGRIWSTAANTLMLQIVARYMRLK